MNFRGFASLQAIIYVKRHYLQNTYSWSHLYIFPQVAQKYKL